MTFSVCCHPKFLLPWQHDVTTSPLYWKADKSSTTYEVTVVCGCLLLFCYEGVKSEQCGTILAAMSRTSISCKVKKFNFICLFWLHRLWTVMITFQLFFFSDKCLDFPRRNQKPVWYSSTIQERGLSFGSTNSGNVQMTASLGLHSLVSVRHSPNIKFRLKL